MGNCIHVMELVWISLLVFCSISGISCQEDLDKKVFIFPESSNTSHVLLKPSLLHPLTAFTICLWSYTDMTRAHTLFSYATKTNDNEIVIFKSKPNEYSLYVGTSDVLFIFPEHLTAKPSWEHICMSWESGTGMVEFWLDGQPLPRNGMMKGHRISPEACIVLGQDQDAFGSGFDINQSFVGEIRDVYMWDRALSDNEMCLVWGNSVPPSPVIDWRALNYMIRDYVVLKPSLSSVCRAG
nr:PREDICTED: serum amyloid P-component isoform X2 [Anolis carolinensis]|eukprot:XP_008120252.1 PREDICTED: serum amyloid P-component isoform X2 [Anolis carolinensis]